MTLGPMIDGQQHEDHQHHEKFDKGETIFAAVAGEPVAELVTPL